MGFSALFLDKDNWRIIAAGGLGSINFQFYLDNPINTWVPYNTSADFAFAQVQRRVYNKIYVGLSYVYTKFKTSTDIFPDTLAYKLNGLGLSVTMDRRVNLYYPRGGFHTKIRYFTYPEALGNDFVSQKIEIVYNHYFPMRNDRDVAVGRFFAGLGIGDLSFNQQFIVGQKDIRGYTQGEFRGNYLLAIQGEYRWNFYKRWSAVGFLGFATVFKSLNEDDEGRILPGIGCGIRFTAFTDNHMNVGIDIAAGRDDWGIYFRIGEAF
jgi:outer membrane translocation and assembly module TamA